MIPPPPTSTLFPYTTLFRSRLVLKWRAPPEHSETTSGYYTEVPSACQTDDRYRPDPAEAPDAGRRPPQLRQPRGDRARGLRLRGHLGAARGDRQAGGRGNRHALPPLPDAPGPARSRLRGGDRPHGREGA